MNSKLIWDLLRGAVGRFSKDDCPNAAAGIAYYALFSVFPLALGLVAILGVLLEPSGVQEQIVAMVSGWFPASRELVEQNVESVVQGRGGVGLVSVAVLLWSATSVMAAIRRALNRAWEVKRERPFVKQKLLELAMVAAVGGLLVASIVSTALLRVAWGLLPSDVRELGEQPIWSAGAGLGPLVLTLGVFALLYRYVPSASVRWGDIWPGALLAALCFEAGKNLFALYMAAFANYALVYGSLSAVIAFLTWAYYSALILLLGAELNVAWSRLHRSVGV